jgi:hypothetical protein
MKTYAQCVILYNDTVSFSFKYLLSMKYIKSLLEKLVTLKGYRLFLVLYFPVRSLESRF